VNPTEPILSPHNTPPGTRRVVYAEDQPEYLPLPSQKTPDGRVVSAWTLDENELLLVAMEVPVYLTLHTFNYTQCPQCGACNPATLQPILLTVGEPSLL
jgi:hypothetical protein